MQSRLDLGARSRGARTCFAGGRVLRGADKKRRRNCFRRPLDLMAYSTRGLVFPRVVDPRQRDRVPTFAVAGHRSGTVRSQLIDAVRNDKPYNEVKRGAEASLVTSMGRMAAHTGQPVTFDEMLNGEHEFAPKVDQLTPDGPAPVTSDSEGRYPIPLPGINNSREY